MVGRPRNSFSSGQIALKSATSLLIRHKGPEHYNQEFKYSVLIQQILKFESNGFTKEPFNVHI